VIGLVMADEPPESPGNPVPQVNVSQTAELQRIG